jgi:hypothetical protein
MANVRICKKKFKHKKNKVRRSKSLIPIEKSCHKEYIYGIPITYHSKDITIVDVFASTCRSKLKLRMSKIMGPIEIFAIRNTHIENERSKHLPFKIWSMLRCRLNFMFKVIR